MKRGRATALLFFFAFPIALVLGALNALLGGGVIGYAIVVVIVIASSLVVAMTSDTLALRLAGARAADGPECARYHNLVEGLCVTAGLPEPHLYVISDDTLNAFVTGRDPQHASIAVTSGLLERSNRVELEAVLAHELHLIRSNDLHAATVAVAMVGLPAFSAEVAMGRRSSGTGPSDAPAIVAIAGYVVLPFVPLLARLLHFAVPASSSQSADFAAVGLTRYPPGLVGVLDKIHTDTAGTAAVGLSSPHRATAHLWFVDPMPRAPSTDILASFRRRFATHPPISERIEALREL